MLKRSDLSSPMATTYLGKLMLSAENGESDEEEKWVSHYSSNHQILLVGEGDFSFSLSLANAFASAYNICASSLDSYDILMKKYKNAISNLENLEKLGACLLHEVDATKMKHHTDLANRRFDRIIFNFPHAGFHGKEDNPHMIRMHRNLVQGFFRSARGMLRANGEIHVNHKTNTPFSLWNLKKLASGCSLALIQRVDFNVEDYPGYHNKRGDGSRCDEPFPLGKSSTFKFGFCPRAKKASKATKRWGSMCKQSQHFQTIPMPMQLHSTSDFNYHRRNHTLNRIPLRVKLHPIIPNQNQYSGVFDRNFNDLVLTCQANSLRSARYDGLGSLRHGLDRQLVEVPRTLNGNLPYMHEHKHEHEVRHSLDRQVVGVPRIINGNLYYMFDHEQARHSLDRQKVEVPRTLHGNSFYMHKHENSLDRQMIEMPRTLNGNSYYMHEHKPARYSVDRQMVEMPRALNGNLYYMHEHGHEIAHISNSRPHLHRALACQAYRLKVPNTRDVLRL
ncbi:heavy metal-associated isoprenylated plant protein 41-like [Gossypium australe]|uniref:Heavy metal-associated isoprenylated plant protein 41-like n=1 Tax=Gossypium australe TaxID=47621 RepID=A0A5B6VDN7_9ROSI|nr:heavy metal-associated isoprenylated plant protein 41-like [Gossypium australe]